MRNFAFVLLYTVCILAGCTQEASITSASFGTLRRAASLYDPKSGRGIETWTTEPTLLTYTGRSFNVATYHNGKHGPIDKFAGMLLETIHFPDSPNQDRFPTTVLRPGEKYHSETEFRFYAE